MTKGPWSAPRFSLQTNASLPQSSLRKALRPNRRRLAVQHRNSPSARPSSAPIKTGWRYSQRPKQRRPTIRWPRSTPAGSSAAPHWRCSLPLPIVSVHRADLRSVADASGRHRPSEIDLRKPPAPQSKIGSSSAVLNEQLSMLDRRLSTSALNMQRLLITIVFNSQAQLLPSVDHHRGIVTIQNARQKARTGRQCSTNESSVRDAFASRRTDRSSNGTGNWLNVYAWHAG